MNIALNGKPVLNGVKTYVNNGEYTPFLLVAAIVQNDLFNLRITAYPIKIGQSMVPFATIAFDSVQLSPDFRLTGGHGGLTAVPPA